MNVITLLSLLFSFGATNAALNGSSAFQDRDTFSIQNVQEVVAVYHIINMTSEVDAQGAPPKTSLAGTPREVIAYPKTNFSHPARPNVKDLYPTMSKTSAMENICFCNVGRQGNYFTAKMLTNYLNDLGHSTIHVGGGPAMCVKVSCDTDLFNLKTAIWFCNDDTEEVIVTYQDIADLAQIVLDQCIEFGTPYSWVRGQAFHTSLPWNVIVTAQDSCDSS